MSDAETPWLAWRSPNQQARLRLFCFPHAGGGAGAYRTWQDYLQPTVEVCPVQIPGREERLNEPCYTRLNDLVESIAESLFQFFDKPYAFFGHSLGAMIAFQLACHLREEGLSQPVHLFASGRRAPQLEVSESSIYDLPDREFLEALCQLNLIRKEIIRNARLVDLVTPILKADYELVQTCIYKPDAPFDFPITVFGGMDDTAASREMLEAWESQTSADFALQIFPGDHFFIQSSQPALLQVITGRLQSHL